MTDLISRQDAIALLEAEKVNAAETEDATDEAYNMAIVHCIKALTNMPSADTDAAKEYLGRRILAEFQKP